MPTFIALTVGRKNKPYRQLRVLSSFSLFLREHFKEAKEQLTLCIGWRLFHQVKRQSEVNVKHGEEIAAYQYIEAEQNGCQIADDILKCVFFNETF